MFERDAFGGSGRWLPHFQKLMRPFRWRLCGATLAMVLDAVLTVCRPWPLKVVVDRVLSSKPTRVPFLGGWLNHTTVTPMHVLFGACAATLVIAIGTGWLTYAFTRTLGEVSQEFVFALRSALFAHLQRLSLRFHDRQRTGDLLTRLTSDTQAIQDVIANGAILLVSNACLLAGMLILMFWLNWQFALAALSGAPFLFWAVYRSTRRVKVAARRARASDGLLSSVAQETLTGIRLVQGLAQEERQDERFRVQGTKSLQAYLEGVRDQARVAPLIDVLAAVGLVIVMWYGAMQVLAGVITTGDMIIFFAYVTNLYSPMKALARLSYALNKAVVGAERIGDVLQVQKEVADQPDARPAPPLRAEITFHHVSFAYTADRTVLSDITLRIAPGERVAIVGETGAGKSTLASLIPRLYDPGIGTVCVDGNDVRTLQLQTLRDQIGLVLQDALLFSGTIRDNIAFGRPDATEQEIIEAAMVANAHAFIQQLPDGYDTPVAERGATLSGGQKQRVAIARAVLRNAPILILDEPTSGLDLASERLVVDALERAAYGRTTLMITHRLGTVRFADRIIVLDHGQIAEDGTHVQLLAKGGQYARLHQLQTASVEDNLLSSVHSPDDMAPLRYASTL